LPWGPWCFVVSWGCLGLVPSPAWPSRPTPRNAGGSERNRTALEGFSVSFGFLRRTPMCRVRAWSRMTSRRCSTPRFTTSAMSPWAKSSRSSLAVAFLQPMNLLAQSGTGPLVFLEKFLALLDSVPGVSVAPALPTCGSPRELFCGKRSARTCGRTQSRSVRSCSQEPPSLAKSSG
jgi:hypothetical protein